MSLVFEPTTHSYKSIDASDTTVWTSVTTLIGHLKQPFDSNAVAKKSAANKKGKWYGMSVDEIQAVWKKESDRACNLGNWYHDQREQDITGCVTLERHSKELPVIRPMFDEHGKKMAPSQKLIEGIYPEHMVYLRSAGVCGQSDLVEVANGAVYITDYKTNKEIKAESFRNWEGISQKMSFPVSHLDDCNLNHYNLQLSIYMYMILKHNPQLKPGGLIIHHIVFEEEDDKDEFGYPISKLDSNGDPIVKDVIPYELPYLKDEVLSIMSWYKDNAAMLIKKKKK
jgi:ATP-dependent exoDNAse (exonuclease V) beta subunit